MKFFFFCLKYIYMKKDLNRSNFLYENIETPHGRFDEYVNIARKRFYNYGMGSFGL